MYYVLIGDRELAELHGDNSKRSYTRHYHVYTAKLAWAYSLHFKNKWVTITHILGLNWLQLR